ncbi:N-6 DNA methylase [Klebsiella pneumoniae]|uniref:N-6 DNA methylase n=1 Tax=Klebsiella pneumoniae TaxID=573 RepID=UPI000808EF0F|nr:N-6 DNA methylase [Klebsiella pneumoniae]ECH8361647.1 N-6 DNA methylase [Salmonella enterica subsp. enterica serovar Muenchen]ECX0390998.1 N-6 DNA methylase [Salmonella enterica subsp. enterica serovar Newport]SBZ35491.1 Type I restriction-modification system methyltransferase subunit [Klebsiella pneumoniae]HCI6033134.1 N-6 DNA methylase [Klebsiella quasipneumoniae subsp. quasipneumoniae]
MKKQFKKTLESIQTRSNRSISNTVREFFNCVSYTMIMNSLFQLEQRELFYSGDSIHSFNKLLTQSGLINKSITLTDRHEFKIEEKFYNQFEKEIIEIANMISIEINKNPLTDIFNEIFEECYLTGKKGDSFGQFLTPTDISELLTDIIYRIGNDKYKIADICAGTGSLIFPLLKRIFLKEGFEGIQKVELVYNDKDSFVSQLFIAQILTNMIYHNLDFKDLRVYIGDAITEYDTINTLFLRVKQNKLVAQRVLEIDREKKAA